MPLEPVSTNATTKLLNTSKLLRGAPSWRNFNPVLLPSALRHGTIAGRGGQLFLSFFFDFIPIFLFPDSLSVFLWSLSPPVIILPMNYDMARHVEIYGLILSTCVRVYLNLRSSVSFTPPYIRWLLKLNFFTYIVNFFSGGTNLVGEKKGVTHEKMGYWPQNPILMRLKGPNVHFLA